MLCNFCSKTNKSESRLPVGWHRHQEKILCKDCWKSKFCVRAITFPIASIIDGEWADFRKAMTASWQQSTMLANWAVKELSVNDILRKPDDKKLAPMPPIYLYGLAAKKYPHWSHWDGGKNTAQCIFRSVEAKYKATRFDVIWRQSAVIPTYRFPYPYPVHNADWEASYGKDDVPILDIPLGGKRWKIRLKGGSEFKRQLKGFRQIVSGEAIQCEAAILRSGDKEMVKLVAWFPKEVQAESTGKTMLLRTDPNALWVAETEGKSPWILNADEVKQQHMAHKVYLQRLSEDTKFEKRWDDGKIRQINQSREKRCRKHASWIDTYTHQVTAMLTKYAQRQRVDEVIYDDSNKSWLTSFPWHMLKTKLSYKLDAVGIKLISNPADQKTNVA